MNLFFLITFSEKLKLRFHNFPSLQHWSWHCTFYYVIWSVRMLVDSWCRKHISFKILWGGGVHLYFWYILLLNLHIQTLMKENGDFFIILLHRMWTSRHLLNHTIIVVWQLQRVFHIGFWNENLLWTFSQLHIFMLKHSSEPLY